MFTLPWLPYLSPTLRSVAPILLLMGAVIVLSGCNTVRPLQDGLWMPTSTVGPATDAVPTRDTPSLASPSTIDPTQATSVTAAAAVTSVSLASVPAAQPTPTPPALPVVTARVTVNLRAGPGTDYAVTGRLTAGAAAVVRGQSPDGQWWQVIDPATEAAAWISADPALTEIQGDPAVPVVDAPAVAQPPSPLPPPTSEPAPPAAPVLALVHQFDVAATTIAFSPDGQWLALATLDDEIQVYQTADWSLRWRGTHSDHIANIAYSPNGQVLASAGWDGVAKVWEAATGDLRYQIQHSGWVAGPRFSADSLFLATAGSDGKVVVSRVSDGQILGEYVNQLPVWHLDISPDGPWLAVVTHGSWGPVEVAVWDFLTHERRTLSYQEVLPSPSNVVFSPDTQWLVARVEPLGPLRIWQTQIWPEVTQLDAGGGNVTQAAFSPNGTWLAALVFRNVVDSVVRIWRVPQWELVTEVELGDIALDMAISPNSTTLATIHGQGEPPVLPLYEGRLWSLAGGELLGVMPHTLQVQGLAFSADGRWVATGSIDGTTKVWLVPD